MEKVDARATPSRARAGSRWTGERDARYSRGTATKQATPSIMTRFLPRRSDRTPKGRAETIVDSPATEARAPIIEGEAPRELAKKGKVGIVAL